MKILHRSPLRCMICQVNACYEELPVCADCAAHFQEILTAPCCTCGKSALDCRCHDSDKVRYMLFYNSDFFVRYLIHYIKANVDDRLMDFLAEMLVYSCGLNIKRYDAVAFVPRLPRNRRRCGHDQAQELAKALSRVFGIPVIKALKRVGGKDQKLLSRSERLKNVRGKYRLRKGYPNETVYNSLLLVDDIYTTGATMKACSELLRGTVSRTVTPLVLAKTNFLNKKI